MSIKILKNVGSGTELAKRTCLEGVVLEKKCECGAVLKNDLSSDYLSYPTVGSWENIYFYCDDCHAEYDDSVKVRIILDLEIKEE